MLDIKNRLSSIQFKLLISIILLLLIVFSITIFIILNQTRESAIDDAIQITMSESREYARIIENELEEGRIALESLANRSDDIRELLREDDEIIKHILANDNFNNLWLSINDENHHLRYHVDNGEIVEGEITYDYIRENSFQEDTILEPYQNVQDIYVSALVIPVIENGEIIGNIGLAMNFDGLLDTIESFEIFDTGFSRLLSNQGIVVAHPNPDRLWQLSGDFTGEDEEIFREVVEEGHSHYELAYSESIGDEVFKSFEPVIIGDSNTPWSFGAVVPQEEMYAEVTALTRNIIIISAISFIIIAIAVFILIKPITDNIKKIKGYALELADSDFTFEIDNKILDKNDELGELANSFVLIKENLKEVISSISEISESLSANSQELSANSEEMSASAHEVSTAIEEVASGSEEQSAQIDETKSRISTLNEQIDSVASSAEEIGEKTKQVNQEIENGNKSIESSSNKVKLVEKDAGEVAENINKLGELSNEIEQILEIINSIAEQTNLLALNASIEAARAGEAGQGFNVVANEIRELAEETAKSTDKIDEIIQEVQNNTQKTMNKMAESKENVNETVTSIKETENAFSEINQAIDILSEKVDDIVANSDKMAANSREVGSAIEEVAQVSEDASRNAESVAISTDEQSRSTEEIVKATEDLAEMAQELAEKASQFKL